MTAKDYLEEQQRKQDYEAKHGKPKPKKVMQQSFFKPISFVTWSVIAFLLLFQTHAILASPLRRLNRAKCQESAKGGGANLFHLSFRLLFHLFLVMKGSLTPYRRRSQQLKSISMLLVSSLTMIVPTTSSIHKLDVTVSPILLGKRFDLDTYARFPQGFLH